MDAFLYLALVLFVFCIFTMVRNQFVCSVRIAVIDANGLFDGRYETLPSYDAMVFMPKYWLLWTEGHWSAWIARQPKGAMQ